MVRLIFQNSLKEYSEKNCLDNTPGFNCQEVSAGVFAFYNGGVNLDDVMFFHGTNIMNQIP